MGSHGLGCVRMLELQCFSFGTVAVGQPDKQYHFEAELEVLCVCVCMYVWMYDVLCVRSVPCLEINSVHRIATVVLRYVELLGVHNCCYI